MKPALMLRFTVAALVAGLAYSTAAHAVVSFTTANAVLISYNLAPNTDSIDYSPSLKVPTHLMVDCLTPGDSGIFDTVLTVIPTQTAGGTVNEVYWDINNVSNSATATGSHMLSLNSTNLLWIEVGSIGKIRVSNESGVQQSGYVTLLW